MKLILIGFMGSGKSTVASILARKLNIEFIDMDKHIEKKAGMSIENIFEQKGETAFREFEIALAKELQSRDNVVIATGGGVVMNGIIIDYLYKNAIIIALQVSFETTFKRIATDIPRPLFKDKEKAEYLYKLRRPLYTHYANIDIPTDNKAVEEIVAEIIKHYEHLS